jgi:small-conductance mechanosensitive channel/CRP-like cAMP-binding protein
MRPGLFDQYSQLHISWTAMAMAFVAAVGTLFLRRLLPEAGRARGKLPILFLIISIILRLVAVPVEIWATPKVLAGFNLAAAISLTVGLTGISGMVIFDLFLLRVGVRVPTILRGILLVIAFVIALMTILRQSGANIVGLFATSAVLTAVIGLALQEPIANMFAGLSLQMDGTLSIGDWIKVGERIGRVEKISFRATSISTRDDDTVTLPNRHFMQHEILNYSRPSARHRMHSVIGLHYQHPPNEVKQLLSDAVRDCPGVLTDPPPVTVVTGFGDSAINYTVLYWITDFGRDIHIESDVRTRMWYAARRAKLEIPYQMRTVHMHHITEASERVENDRDYMARLGALSKVELFSMLDDSDVELLARGMRAQPFARGETLIRQGDPGDSLFLISSGEVNVSLGIDGVQRQVATLHAGDLLGEQSLMTGDPRAATCIAASDVTCHLVSHDLFKELLALKPKLAEDISALLSQRQTALEAEREGLSAEAAAQRQAEAKKRLLGRMRKFFHLG